MSGCEHLVVVTGMSGAGKSTALHALEDLGFFCVDNMPPPVAGATLVALGGAGVSRVAFGIDVRVRSFVDGIGQLLDSVGDVASKVDVLFLDAADASLLRRFSSTRRPHPLSTVSAGSNEAPAVLDGIMIEREKLAPLRARATHVVDTSRLSVHELRRRVLKQFGADVGGAPRMRLRIVSFGFKYGPPADADLVFDVRFLKNPYFEDDLRELTGKDEPVRRFVLGEKDSTELLWHVLSLLEFCIPRYEQEGKSYLTVAIGCTGGRHRSVALAETIAAQLRGKMGGSVDLAHRDVDRVTMDRESEPGGSQS
ncbi:MAG: RNase adapter RapZ [Polyangiaceae bacterium]